MTLPTALRLTGWFLAAVAAGSLVLAAYSIVGTMAASGGPDASMGLLVLFMGGALQSIWQAAAGAALALLCFAAARLLETISK